MTQPLDCVTSNFSSSLVFGTVRTEVIWTNLSRRWGRWRVRWRLWSPSYRSILARLFKHGSDFMVVSLEYSEWYELRLRWSLVLIHARLAKVREMFVYQLRISGRLLTPPKYGWWFFSWTQLEDEGKHLSVWNFWLDKRGWVRICPGNVLI